MRREGERHRGVKAPAFWLGFALAGFFDGILLHQVLQWHHLLSNLEGAASGGLRLQIAADGYFHALMYLLLVAAIWMIWKRRGALAGTQAGAGFLRYLAIGFGVWQVVDVVVFHWLIGLHNVRVGVDNPLIWDAGWLLVFGFVPLLLAATIRPSSGGPAGGGAALGAILLTLSAGVWAGRPASRVGPSTIVFAPWVASGEAFAATLARSEALIWLDQASGVYVVSGLSSAEARELYASGVIFISGRGFPPGCFSNNNIARVAA